MFAQHSKNGDNEDNGKEKKQRPRINLDYTTCNECGERGHYSGNNDWPTQDSLKEDADAFIKTNKEKSSNKPSGGGDQKAFVNTKDTLCSPMMGSPIE